ncbi:MAG: hypothetical protein RMK81_06425 [Geminicoccaceae bacterium]|nr:hypothetical protein [Geminicoccaceae bacterium]
MTVFRYYVPPDEILDPSTIFGEASLVSRSESKLVLALDSELYVLAYGRFSFSSENDFLDSVITRVVLSNERSGDPPLFTADNMSITVGSLARNPNTIYSGNDVFIGSPGDDELTFFEAPAFGRGNDTLRGGGGGDALHGGIGADKLYGEAGDDTLYLGPGKDQATGGPGADRFVLLDGSRGSAIRDFDAAAGDRLELRASELFSDPAAASADPEGFVRITAKGSKVTLFLDPDGGGDSFVKWASIKGDLGSTDLDTLIAEGTLVIG